MGIPIIGTVLLAGINPSGEPKYIDGTVLLAGLNASGEIEYIDPDNLGSGSGGAPTGAQYIVGAAHADLSAELVLGTAVIMAGLASARPSASLAGLLYFATDTNILYRDTGVAWVSVNHQPYLHYQDQKAQNTAGGTFTQAAWQTRVLNTEVTDTDAIGALATNQVTIPAGTYRALAHAPALAVQGHQARIQNITAGTTLLLGPGVYTSDATNVCNEAIVDGQFVLASSSAIELQHRCTLTKATTGFGVNNNWGVEVFADLQLWKIA